MASEPKYIQRKQEHEYMFSVCSLVRDANKYQKLLKSFEKFGFTSENTEFLAADNREINQFDGFNWVRRMLPECSGKYVIFCHEDIVLMDDGFVELVERLEGLDEIDPNWLLAGIAGGQYRSSGQEHPQVLYRITDKYGSDRRSGHVPGRVETLDECFFLMKREKPVANSYDMYGFHFYGSDICLIAELVGGSSYAIDFHLRHKGKAIKGASYQECEANFVEKYSRVFPGRIVHGTTGVFRLGGGWADMK